MQTTLSAQELNIGLHVNPAFTSLVVNERSVKHEELKTGSFRLGYNVGANVNYKLKKASVELAANLVRKSVSFYRRTGHALKGSSYYRVNMPGTSYEFPLLVNLLLDRHDKKSIYDLYFVAGAAFEIYRQDSTVTSSAAGTGLAELYVTGGYKGPLAQRTITPVAGIKINTIVRGFGLIDYGVTVHVPLLVSGPYDVEATYRVGANINSFYNTLYVQPAYVDIKFCYYLLNFDKRFKRLRYRGG